MDINKYIEKYKDNDLKKFSKNFKFFDYYINRKNKYYRFGKMYEPKFIPMEVRKLPIQTNEDINFINDDFLRNFKYSIDFLIKYSNGEFDIKNDERYHHFWYFPWGSTYKLLCKLKNGYWLFLNATSDGSGFTYGVSEMLAYTDKNLENLIIYGMTQFDINTLGLNMIIKLNKKTTEII